MVAVWRIATYHRADAPVTTPVTKFGGQPTWLSDPQWPISAASGEPMRFVGQIALDPEITAGEGRLAYVFVTHGDHGRDVEEFDPDVIFPDGGENAVVVQPGRFSGPTRPLVSGPTLYHEDGSPAEYTVDLVRGEDPDPLSTAAYLALSDEDRERYFEAVEYDKVGGTVVLTNDDDWPAGGPWRPLLRLATNWTPFRLNLGSGPVAFAFLSADGAEGCLLVEDS